MKKLIKKTENLLGEEVVKSMIGTHFSLPEFLTLTQPKKICYYYHVILNDSLFHEFNDRIWESLVYKSIESKDYDIVLKSNKGMLLPFCKGVIDNLSTGIVNKKVDEKKLDFKLSSADKFFEENGMEKRFTYIYKGKTISDLLALKKEDLLEIKGVGMKTIDKMNEILSKKGYAIN